MRRLYLSVVAVLLLAGCQTAPKPETTGDFIGFPYTGPIRSQQMEAVFPDVPPPSK